MSFFKTWGEFMIAATRAHAAWELETSNRVISDPKRLLVLILLVAPILIFGPTICAAMADHTAAAGGALPDVLGGKKAYSPAFYSTGIFIASILELCGAVILRLVEIVPHLLDFRSRVLRLVGNLEQT